MGKRFLSVLGNRRASVEDRLYIAARHAGDLVVVDDALCDALIRVVSGRGRRGKRCAPPPRFRSAPVLEEADTEGFDEDDDYSGVPINRGQAFHRVSGARFADALYSDAVVPQLVRRPNSRSLRARHRRTGIATPIRQAYSGWRPGTGC